MYISKSIKRGDMDVVTPLPILPEYKTNADTLPQRPPNTSFNFPNREATVTRSDEDIRKAYGHIDSGGV